MSVPSRLGSPPEADSCRLHLFHQLHLFQNRPSFSALRKIENIEKTREIIHLFQDFQIFNKGTCGGRPTTSCRTLQHPGMPRLVAMSPWATQLASPCALRRRAPAIKTETR